MKAPQKVEIPETKGKWEDLTHWAKVAVGRFWVFGELAGPTHKNKAAGGTKKPACQAEV